MREFTFIRRYLQLNTAEEVFRIKQETVYTVKAEHYEDAVAMLVQQIDSMEGQDGVLVNNGFPAHCTTWDTQTYYLAMHALSAFVYQQDDTCSASSFQEQLAQMEEGGEDEIYQGFYADAQLLYPRALTVHRLQYRGDECNYLFETEGGRYKGEYDKYLWYGKVLYKSIGVENSENKSVGENV